MTKPAQDAFTLIEISIVLVILGLLVGGILAGKELLESSKIRSQIAQIDQFKAATKTFQTKYNCLPGDCLKGADYGFVTRENHSGRGDGNGVIEGNTGGSDITGGFYQSYEPIFFWQDLQEDNLIAGTFNSGNPPFSPLTISTVPSLYQFFPVAKLGNGNFVTANSKNNVNYLSIQVINQLGSGGNPTTTAGVSVTQANSIDAKIDDGKPVTGKVLAQYLYYNGVTFSGTASSGISVAASPTTCYDNNAITSTPIHYSTDQNRGEGLNCGLAFQF